MASTINATTTNGVAVTGDTSGSLALQTNNGTTAVTIDTSQNVGIGTTTPFSSVGFSKATELYSPTSCSYQVNSGGTYIAEFGISSSGGWLGTSTNYNMRFATNGTERMRIDSSGYVGVNTASPSTLGGMFNVLGKVGVGPATFQVATNGDWVVFKNASGSVVGKIQIDSASTSYVTTSDYRLKENIASMTGALEVVSQLKPVTYTWKETGESTQGFIAHELQEIIPDAVTGKKDELDKDGNPIHQGIDPSKLVATLTAAIQELKAIVDAQQQEINALKGVTN